MVAGRGWKYGCVKWKERWCVSHFVRAGHSLPYARSEYGLALGFDVMQASGHTLNSRFLCTGVVGVLST